MLGDHILYSHYFSDLEGVAKRNLTLITIEESSAILKQRNVKKKNN